MNRRFLHPSGLGVLTMLLLFPFSAIGQNEQPPLTRYELRQATKPVEMACDPKSWQDYRALVLRKSNGKLLGGFVKEEIVKEISKLPDDAGVKLEAFEARYKFQWDKEYLYAYVEVRDPVVDNGHPPYETKEIFSGPVGSVILPDWLYDEVLVIAAAPRWDGRVTEMHLNIRPPGAKQPLWIFYGRTGADEYFSELKGEAVACATPTGYAVVLRVAWLTFEGWHPEFGEDLELQLFAFLSDKPGRPIDSRTDKLVALMASYPARLNYPPK